MLIFIFTICTALILSITSAFTFWPVAQWYDLYRPLIMLITGYVLGIGLVWVFYDISGRITSSYKKNYTKPSKFARFMINDAIIYVNIIANIKLKAFGLDKIPSEPFLLVGNHKSRFDSMLVSQVLSKVHIAFITKEENMKVPLMARFVWRNCYMPVNRKDKLQSLAQFNKAAKLIADKVSSVGVYPEGTRQNDDIILGDFHNGAFTIAIRTKCPIVMITTKGTSGVKKNFPKRTKVEMNCRVLYYQEDYASMNATQLSNHVHEIMYKELSEK